MAAEKLEEQNTAIVNPATGRLYSASELERTLADARRVIKADFERRRKAAARLQRWRDNHKGGQ